MHLPPIPPLDADQDPWQRLSRDAARGTVERPPPGLTREPRPVDASLGEQTAWQATFPWEGQDFLHALEALTPPAGAFLEITAFLSESSSTRQHLAERVRALASTRGWNEPTVRVRSAYKPAYHWAREELLPHALTLGADTLQLRYPVLPPEPAGRFLHETYPLAAHAERLGLTLELSADDTLGPAYHATLLRQGAPVDEATCAVPLTERATPTGSPALSPTGWVSVRAGTQVLLDQRVITDAERVWDWYLQTVLPDVTNRATFTPGRPGFRTLRVTMDVSEPDDELGVGDERASMTEALSEDVYFGTLEALKAHAGHDLDSRALQPGQIIPVVRTRDAMESRVHVTLTAYQAPAIQAAEQQHVTERDVIEAHHAPLPDGPTEPEQVWARTRHLAQLHALEWHVPAYSYDGRPIPMAVRSTGRSALLVTAGQHANEASGVTAALELLDELARADTLDFAVAPLENPDGAALHLELTRVAPRHMHHAARYTALGDDLEARVVLHDARWEARARVWAAHALRPRLHLSLHGYPAHEWTRPFCGYAPRGFESWALPIGFLTIIRHHPDGHASAQALAESIARSLRADEDIAAHTDEALRWSAAHVHARHYTLVNGMPFLFQARADLLAPLVVITEVPDETVYGEAFRRCVRAHVLTGRACMTYLQ